jgi:hypothetical protein
MKNMIYRLRSAVFTTAVAGVVTMAASTVSAGLIAHFRFNGTLNDEKGNHHGRLRDEFGVPLFEPGKHGDALRIESVATSVELANPNTIDFSRNFTIAAWVKTTATGERIVIYKGDPDSFGRAGDPSKQFQVYGGGGFGGPGLFFHSAGSGAFGTSFAESHGISVNDDNWHHIAFTYDPAASPTLELYVDGFGKGPADAGRYVNWSGQVTMVPERTNAVVRIGGRAGQEYPYFIGLMDEFQLYNQTLDDAQVRFLANNPGQVILPPEQPTIFVQPELSRTVPDGTNVTFSVMAESQTPLSYQWQFNGVNLPGATSAELVLTNVKPEQSGLYTVAISNALGSVTSRPARLMVLPGGRPILDLSFYTGIALYSPVGTTNRIEYLEDNNWITLTNVTLLQTPRLIFDAGSARIPQRAYQVRFTP